ncbi:major capsid protein [Haloarcula californiae tailed virus 1]|uniref:Major capsid protein n=1 Tax=Haloarcula californiae tailed virus 1 TaxID=1273746 RepID=R4TI17_9CAUD|nr:major head protein [Haloarcula californiae tailed virus 1]AGM11971.1 major capsid protein [Haloarcula californiae tailed virus 1]UBF23099.1 major capsid protein [Haloarcula virus HCTV-16]
MGAITENGVQLAKAQISKHRKLMKSTPARKYLAKRQLERGGDAAGAQGRQQGLYKTSARGPKGENPGQLRKADGRIHTVYDLIDYYYDFYPKYTRKNSGNVSKADNILDTTDAGYRNVVYGSEVFSLLNSEANLFALLENRAWTKSGERIVTGRDSNRTLGDSGTGENASLPDTIHPELDEYEQNPRSVVHTFNVSQEKQLLAQTNDDDLDDPFDFLRRWYGEGTEHQTGMGEHPKDINVQLLDESDSPSGDNMESIDRVISDGSESSLLSDAGDNDIYGFDRSNNEFESNVLHNSDSNRSFTINLMDDAIEQVKTNSGKNPVQDDGYFWLTGHDTYKILEQEVGGKERLEPVRAQVGMNGVQTNPGDDVGIITQSYKTIPIFESDDVVQDDSGLSRVYLVDSETMFIKTLLPTQFYSTGTEVDDNPFAIDQLGNEGAFVTIGQLTCTNPAAHAKIRDLK